MWLVGVAGWFVSYKMGAWDVDPGLPDDGREGSGGATTTTGKIGLALGYVSAVAYLW